MALRNMKIARPAACVRSFDVDPEKSPGVVRENAMFRGDGAPVVSVTRRHRRSGVKLGN
jgi:hypothetical protein